LACGKLARASDICHRFLADNEQFGSYRITSGLPTIHSEL
jgi:hypothetical protein